MKEIDKSSEEWQIARKCERRDHPWPVSRGYWLSRIPGPLRDPVGSLNQAAAREISFDITMRVDAPANLEANRDSELHWMGLVSGIQDFPGLHASLIKRKFPQSSFVPPVGNPYAPPLFFSFVCSVLSLPTQAPSPARLSLCSATLFAPPRMRPRGYCVSRS